MLITNRRLAPFVSVTGQLAADGAVELIELDVDAESPWTADDNETND